jgi:uncharacterized glyoxalase superfamily protein PhnB
MGSFKRTCYLFENDRRAAIAYYMKLIRFRLSQLEQFYEEHPTFLSKISKEEEN